MNASSPRATAPALRAFTLIELLSVVAIIGILAAITIPVVGSVRDTAKKTKTRAQFSQWAAGIRSFKTLYGYFPRFEQTAASSANHKVNGGLTYSATTLADNDYLFRELLSGKGAKTNGTGVLEFYSTEKESKSPQNKKRSSILSFDTSEITSTTGADASDPDIKVDGALKDAFGNVEIAVIVDRNGDGFINKTDLIAISEYPALTAKGNRGVLKSTLINTHIEASDASKRGVRTDVIFYSPGKGDSGGEISATKAVWSW